MQSLTGIRSRSISNVLAIVARRRRRSGLPTGSRSRTSTRTGTPHRAWPGDPVRVSLSVDNTSLFCSSSIANSGFPLHFYSTSTTAPYHPTASTASSASPAAADASSPPYDLEIEQYVRHSMLQFLPNKNNNNDTTFISRRVGTPQRAASSQLDLELGDFSDSHNRRGLAIGAYDDHLWSQDDEDLDEDDSYDAGSSMSDATPLHHAASTLDDIDRPMSMQHSTTNVTMASHGPKVQGQKLSKKTSVLELLASFDPMNPPKVSEYQNREDALNAIQLWMECEAQQESVLRYQKVIDDARARHDFSSLSMIQKQIVRWFGPLQEAFETKQKNYLQGTPNEGKSVKKFGPFICTLPPTKLAVIVAHEAVMKSIINGHTSSHVHSVLGVPLSSMAMRLGQAVEDELVVHRLLHRRAQDATSNDRNASSTSSSGFERDVSAVYDLIPDDDGAEDDSNDDYDYDESATHDHDEGIDRDLTEPSALPKIKPNLDQRNVTHKWTYASSHLKNYLDEISNYKPSAKKRRVTAYAIQRARQVLDREEEWTAFEKMQLGAALLQPLLETATIMGENGQTEPAFSLEKHWVAKDKTMSFISMNNRLFKMIVSDKLESLSATTTRHKPMIVPPKPWTAANDGGYHMLKVDLMRYHGCHTQREAMRNAESSTVFDGLNALGKVKWKINKRLLKVAQQCWDENIPLGDVPSRTDGDIPEEPLQPVWNEIRPEKGTEEYEQSLAGYKTYREQLARHRRAKQKVMDLRSLRCSAILKLDQAEKFKNFDEIYFPYNMDFRGRAYPVPPHLSNVGSDLCRGMLVFAEEKPLGERGLYWLKVHLANFAGKDKISFDDRAKFVDDNMDKVRDSALDPFGGERWWMSLDDPFQGLATCFEVVDAIDSGDPTLYRCSLPVHMDGSCNGLQHYAALGRDSIGGKAVNLCATEEPQDVYIGVMHEVVRRVAEEANRELGFDTTNVETLSKSQKKELAHNKAAKLVNGHIDRGVVKRTVMTSVYGVTYVGAREQIQEKVEEKLEAQGHDIDEINREVFQACGYLALITMEVIGDLFSGAKGTMNWLTTCARMISQHGYPVAWISPIGVPAIQPYRQKKTATLVTLLQTVSLAIVSDDLPINKAKQVTAFPPNYIHSLDSSHMLLTALEMDRRGLTFSAVHDSFWTHSCDIDEMNVALRDVFVDLYSQPLLERLKETWEMRYPGLIFPDLPERGDLDLTEVKKAKYFFQ